MQQPPHILVAPLDWGLGHATRCIPIIQALLQAGCRVSLAADGPQARLLQEAFPQLTMHQLPGYGIHFGKGNVLRSLLQQVPAILKAIRTEHDWLQHMQSTHAFDAVISDNRYGLYHAVCPSILITHQLQPAMPNGWGWSQALARKFFYRRIEKFTACWVPDDADDTSALSGILGHPNAMPCIPVHYVGWLSRMQQQPELPNVYDVMMLLSGPEPQRSMLENRLLQQLQHYRGKAILVRGLPGAAISLPINLPHVTVYHHLPAAALQTAMMQSSYIICRGGYSTLMDAFTLRKKCLLIPTPGQTEQVYLAQTLAAKQQAICFAQDDFDLSDALQQAEAFQWQSLPEQQVQDSLQDFITTWVGQQFLNDH
jgi:UDP-N-acetylglucosamine transferase subunit ALG13